MDSADEVLARNAWSEDGIKFEKSSASADQFSFSAGEIKIAEGSVQLPATTTPIVAREQCERVAEPRGESTAGSRGH